MFAKSRKIIDFLRRKLIIDGLFDMIRKGIDRGERLKRKEKTTKSFILSEKGLKTNRRCTTRRTNTTTTMFDQGMQKRLRAILMGFYLKLFK